MFFRNHIFAIAPGYIYNLDFSNGTTYKNKKREFRLNFATAIFR